MLKHSWIDIAAALLVAAFGSAMAAGSNARYTVNVWTTDEGLPQNVVMAMTQTRDGYLWLGTLDGLVRFDGIGHAAGAGRTQFAVFGENNTPGLNSSRIFKLFEDSQGNLWIGTETAGVVLVSKDGKVASIDIGRGAREGVLRAACEDSSGAVWLYTANGQLCRYKDQRVDVWNAGPPGLSDCRALVADDSGLLRVGTDWSLSVLDPSKVASGVGLPPMHELRLGRLDFILASKQGGYWRLANGRIQKFKDDRLQHDWGAYPWSANVPVEAACEDRSGNLVVGTYGDGVYWFDEAGKAERLQGLSHSYILSLTVDQEGCLWVGTNGGGLNRVKRQVFDVLEGTQGSTVQSVCEDQHGGLWIGYNGERLGHWSAGVLEPFGNLWPVPPAVRQNLVLYLRSVLVDRDQQVWAGAFSAWGPHLFKFQNGRFQPAAEAEVLDRDVSALYQDRHGTLWAGTEGGLARWDGRNWKVFTMRDGLSSDLVRAIADDAEGNLWVGTERGGLNRLRDGRFNIFRKQEKDGLPSDDISSIYVDSTGVLWVGTSGGLARFEGGKWTRFTTQEGLLTSSVGYLIEDDKGSLWMGSTAGLMRVRKKDLNDFAKGLTNSIQCRAYGKPDGLPASECTSGSQPAACRSREGRLWFPTIKGLVTVNPAELNQNTNPPPVVIESVLIDGQLHNSIGLRAKLPESVTVPAGKERLEIDYTSLNLGAPDRARFQYRMEGHEKDWTPAGNIRAAQYHRLPPGNYRFQVKACNEDGVWSEPGSTLAITVLPPIWRTWWFLSSAAIALLAMIVGSVHYVSTQRLQRQLEGLRQQEALEKERARIARDLHDQLGANLTQVALLGELAETDKNSPAEIEAHARQISHTARETTRALDEIVWTVNPSNDTLDGLVTYVCKYAQEYFAIAGLRYRLDVPPVLPHTPISPEVRHNVFLAAKEAVNNVVKHAQAAGAWLRLRLNEDRFMLEIEDNGRGLSGVEEKAGRNGLSNMRKRMEDIGGSFSIGAGAEAGTLVQLIVPLSHPMGEGRGEGPLKAVSEPGVNGRSQADSSRFPPLPPPAAHQALPLPSDGRGPG